MLGGAVNVVSARACADGSALSPDAAHNAPARLREYNGTRKDPPSHLKLAAIGDKQGRGGNIVDRIEEGRARLNAAAFLCKSAKAAVAHRLVQSWPLLGIVT